MTTEFQSEAESPQAANDRASVWMKKGIALLEQRSEAALKEAIGYFEQAIQLRNGLPLTGTPWFRYCLAAGWMNRGDALTRLGGKEMFAESVRSYDAALDHLRLLPLDADPLYGRRLAIAFLNRGITLEQAGDFISAAHSFQDAINVLSDASKPTATDHQQLLGCAWMNLGNVFLRSTLSESFEAAQCARNAIAHLRESEQSHPTAAEAAIKARQVLCRALADPSHEKCSSLEDWVSEATDAVDEGLALVRHWLSFKAVDFQNLGSNLFCFGVRVYQQYQPHFLAEFILENIQLMPPQGSPGTKGEFVSKMRVEASSALWRSLRKAQQDGFDMLNAQHFDQFIQKISELTAVEQQLKARATPPGPPATAQPLPIYEMGSRNPSGYFTSPA